MVMPAPESEMTALLCTTCGKPFGSSFDIYRCADCDAPFHKGCIKLHFAEQVPPNEQEALKYWKQQAAAAHAQGKAEGLEEAAKIADYQGRNENDPGFPLPNTAYLIACSDITAAIRSRIKDQGNG